MSNLKRKYRPTETTKNRVTHKEIEKKYRFKYVKDSLIPTLPDYLAYIMIAMVLWLVYFFATLTWGAIIDKSTLAKDFTETISSTIESTGIVDSWNLFLEDMNFSSKKKPTIETF